MESARRNHDGIRRPVVVGFDHRLTQTTLRRAIGSAGVVAKLRQVGVAASIQRHRRIIRPIDKEGFWGSADRWGRIRWYRKVHPVAGTPANGHDYLPGS